MSLKAALLLSTAAVLALSGPAMAADLPMPAAPAMAAPAPGTWDGPYIGASVGYGWGTATNAYTSTDSDTGTESASLSGGLVGVQAGYNFTKNWSANVFYAIAKSDREDVALWAPTTGKLKNRQAAINLLYTSGPYQLGVEWMHDNLDTLGADATKKTSGNQVSVSAQYTF